MSDQNVSFTIEFPDSYKTNKGKWPCDNDFYYPDHVYEWGRIPKGIYKILKRFEHGEGLILKLKPINGSNYFAYAPDNLIFALKINEETTFVQNLGLKLGAKDNKSFEFKLC